MTGTDQDLSCNPKLGTSQGISPPIPTWQVRSRSYLSRTGRQGNLEGASFPLKGQANGRRSREDIQPHGPGSRIAQGPMARWRIADGGSTRGSLGDGGWDDPWRERERERHRSMVPGGAMWTNAPGGFQGVQGQGIAASQWMSRLVSR